MNTTSQQIIPMSDPTQVLANMRQVAQAHRQSGNREQCLQVLNWIMEIKTIWASQEAGK